MELQRTTAGTLAPFERAVPKALGLSSADSFFASPFPYQYNRKTGL